MPDLTVSAGICSGLIAFAAERGADAGALLERAGLAGAALDDPDGRVPFERYAALMRAGKEMTNDPALALHYGELVDMSEVSILGLIMNASETMLDALTQMQRFGRLAVDVDGASAEARFQAAERDGGLWLVDTRIDPNAFPELTETGFSRLVCGPRRFLPKPHVLEVHVTHAAPVYRAEYERIFQCPVTFESDWNALRLDPSIATWRVAQQPRYFFDVFAERAGALLKNLEALKTTRGRIEAFLLPILHTGEIGADRVAAAMGFSRQTLFRKLKSENTTYEQVLDDLRHRMAMHYLTGKKASVNETAYLVGFSDAPAFSRAFKRWTGQNPRDAIAPKPGG